MWVKHENHTSIGTFKIRGALFYIAELRRKAPEVEGVIAATRGNFGQSVAFAAVNGGLRTVIVVARNNSKEKNAAMRALGAQVIQFGRDFQEALEYAEDLARETQLHFVDSFNLELVQGVASYGLELFRSVPNLDFVYVPIGLGSGICGTIAARNALGSKTKIIGVVPSGAPAYALSFQARKPVSTATVNTIADGMACRVPITVCSGVGGLLAGTAMPAPCYGGSLSPQPIYAPILPPRPLPSNCTVWAAHCKTPLSHTSANC